MICCTISNTWVRYIHHETDGNEVCTSGWEPVDWHTPVLVLERLHETGSSWFRFGGARGEIYIPNHIGAHLKVIMPNGEVGVMPRNSVEVYKNSEP